MNKFDYLILDCESYLHQACVACKTILPLPPPSVDMFVEAYDLKLGTNYIDKVVDNFIDMFSSRDIVLVIGDKENFRKSINPSYKAHRGSKPLMYEHLLTHIINKYNVISLPTLEADDTARVIFEDDDKFKGEKLIITIDKDFYSVPCNLYRDNIKDRTIVKVSEEDARINEYVQVIMGDKTDGYSGIPNWGEAKARKFVTATTTLEDIAQLYIDNGLTANDMGLNYSMAHIVGYKEYDFDKMEVK